MIAFASSLIIDEALVWRAFPKCGAWLGYKLISWASYFGNAPTLGALPYTFFLLFPSPKAPFEYIYIYMSSSLQAWFHISPSYIIKSAHPPTCKFDPITIHHHPQSYIWKQTWWCLSVWTKIGQCLEDSSSHCPFHVELVTNRAG